MDAHKVMGDNITYEDLKRIADGNGMSVDETLEMVAKTAADDRATHVGEYRGAAAHEDAAADLA
jgi:hypothetical protein